MVEQPHPVIDTRLLDAAVAVLAESGWEGLRLERVAERAGMSRVTLWRQGVTREGLVDALLSRLADDYRDAMWPVLTAAEGRGRDRLRLALVALCTVADRHLDLLLASDLAFHRAYERARPRPSFIEPLARLVRDGVDDGSLAGEGSAADRAELLFNAVCWTYVHMRGRHGWPAAKARRLVVDLVLPATAP